jgi:N-acetylglucosamine kinase-like BadF-type ATPase
MTTVLGLDIGGTHSRARLVRDGELLAEQTAGSASYTAAGAAAADKALDTLINRLDLGDHPPIDAVCAGAAGSESGSTVASLTEKLAPLTRPGRLLVVSDARLPLPAAGLDEGIGLIAGTGSVALATRAGTCFRAGGWGYLLGDEGSGYWITRRAVRELLHRAEHGNPLGPLGQALLRTTGILELPELIDRFYAHPHPDRWAACAQLVLDTDEPAAAAILNEAAGYLCHLAQTAAARARFNAPPVVLAGGLLTGSPALAAEVTRRLTQHLPHTRVTSLKQPPVAGAIRLALQLADQ